VPEELVIYLEIARYVLYSSQLWNTVRLLYEAVHILSGNHAGKFRFPACTIDQCRQRWCDLISAGRT
jgi:hypothetical protein